MKALAHGAVRGTKIKGDNFPFKISSNN